MKRPGLIRRILADLCGVLILFGLLWVALLAPLFL